MENVDQNLESLTEWVDLIIEFSVTYGFQILGALAFFAFGFIVVNWIGNRLQKIALAKGTDLTLSQFIGSTIKMILMVMLIIITLGNFGISIAPLIALAGAATFGLTMALQGPLSNLGAGLSIILFRPFVIGDFIAVKGVSGIVEKITLGITFLDGEDGEKISIPNKEIVGEILINSDETRILELQFPVAAHVDTDLLISEIETILGQTTGVVSEPAPQVGIQDFTHGGILIGIRAWIPGKRYFPVRFGINSKILALLKSKNIDLLALPFTIPSNSSISSYDD
ncbi:MAG: mechanosensitive ion channel family protein [Sneathiella sp.]